MFSIGEGKSTEKSHLKDRFLKPVKREAWNLRSHFYSVSNSNTLTICVPTLNAKETISRRCFVLGPFRVFSAKTRAQSTSRRCSLYFLSPYAALSFLCLFLYFLSHFLLSIKSIIIITDLSILLSYFENQFINTWKLFTIKYYAYRFDRFT